MNHVMGKIRRSYLLITLPQRGARLSSCHLFKSHPFWLSLFSSHLSFLCLGRSDDTCVNHFSFTGRSTGNHEGCISSSSFCVFLLHKSYHLSPHPMIPIRSLAPFLGFIFLTKFDVDIDHLTLIHVSTCLLIKNNISV